MQPDGDESYELGPPQDPLTLALAMTDTLTLYEAFAVAETATPAQAIAFAPRLVTLLTTTDPVETTLPAASTASFPCV